MGDKKKAGLLLSAGALKKRYPESGLASEICLSEDDSLRLPSRNLAINHHLGGGIRYGSIIEIFGEESTGKTLLAIDFGVVAQSLGGVVLWIDSECTFDLKWAVRHGLDPKGIQLLPEENIIEIISDWIADYCVYWRSKLTNNEPILLVLDSIAILDTADQMITAETDSKAEMGRRSFMLGKLLRKRMRIFKKMGICCLFINQMRSKIGASKFEDPDTTPMAQCMKYYASQRIGLYRGKRIRKGGAAKGKWVGNVVYLRTKKNKTSPPRDNIQAEVYFRPDGEKFGYHKYYGFEELLLERGVVERNRGKYTYKGEIVAKSDEAFKERIATDSDLRAQFIKKLNINTPSRTRKQIEAIDHNLFPVKATKGEKEEETE